MADVRKYNFGVRCKIKVGRCLSRPYFVGFFANNNDAEDFATVWQQYMANRGKVTVTATLHAVGNEELPASFEGEDTKDYFAVAKYKHPSDPSKDSDPVKIFFPGMKGSVNETEMKARIMKMKVLDKDGYLQDLNEVTSLSSRGNNVVTGGHAQESLVPATLP